MGVSRGREGGSVDRDLKPSTDRGVRRQGPGGHSEGWGLGELAKSEAEEGS